MSTTMLAVFYDEKVYIDRKTGLIYVESDDFEPLCCGIFFGNKKDNPKVSNVLLDADFDAVAHEKLNKYAKVSFHCLTNLLIEAKMLDRAHRANDWGAYEEADYTAVKKIVQLVHRDPDKIERLYVKKKVDKEKFDKLVENGYSLTNSTYNYDLLCDILQDKYGGNMHTREEELSKLNLAEFKSVLSTCELELHKAGNCLLKCDNRYMIFGFDDGQYFGCLLPEGEKPKTCGSALKALAPKELDKNRLFARQGEWFFEHYDDDMSFDFEGMTVTANDILDKITFALPRDDEDSNKHEVFAKEMYQDKGGNLYIRDFRVNHREHPAVEHYGWARVLKNRAVISVSADGVD